MKIRLFLLVFTLFTTASRALDLDRLVTPETLTAHREALAFTPEQDSELTRIYESAKTEAELLEAKVRTEQESLEEQLRSDSLDPSAAEASFSKLLEAETALKHLQFKALLALRAVLTPEQIEKAVALGNKDRQDKAPLEAKIEAKASRIKAAFDDLGIKPAESLQFEGEQILEMIRVGDLAAAEVALDELAEKVGIDEPVDTASVDFSAVSPGNTDLEVLKSRLEAVESAAKEASTLPLLRKLLQGRDELEAAKAAEDAERVGRVLTWAEGLLGITTTAP